MTEREIFLDALEREDPAARAAYLDVACAGRPALRRRVEKLLRLHREDPTFLNVPALEQIAAAEESLAFLARPTEPGTRGRLDHYEVLEMVGHGSTGVVLKARDTKLQRVVAIKALAPRLAVSEPARQRFIREAQAAAAVRDDHVVAIHAVSEDGPVPYLVMEYISGLTLEQRLRQRKALDLKEILRIGMQLAAGLAAAHAQGLVHRDIKPGNILLENSVQRVKITDFGLARVVAEAGPKATGALAGTPLYMSPEQARGEPTDQRSDLFSLGSVLYTLCAGRPPFRGETTAEVLSRVIADTPQSIRDINPDVPEWLGCLIGRLHAKEASARPASAREVADLLGGQLALLQQPPLTPPPSSGPVAPGRVARDAPRPPGARRSRRFTLAICLVGLLAALAALAVFLMWRHGGASDHGVEGETPPANSGPAEPLELRREDIPPMMLALAGGGDPAQAPPELAAVLGDGRFLLPRMGAMNWMQQCPDGKVLAVPVEEDVVLFATPTGEYLRSLKGPGGRVVRVSFDCDSRLLAAMTSQEGEKGAVRVWDLHANRHLYTKPVPDPRVSGGTVFSPDGKCLIAGGWKRIHVWDARTGKVVQTLDGLVGGLGSMSFSPDGRRLAAAEWDGKRVKVFDWDGHKLTEVRTLDGRGSAFEAVAYSPDGKYLASGDLQGFIVRNAETLAEVRSVETAARQLAFTPDSRTLWAATTNDQARTVHTFTRWSLDTGEKLTPLSVEVAAVPQHAPHCFSRDGNVLFVCRGTNATYIQAIDPATGQEHFPHQGHVAPLKAVTVSPNGRMIASAGEDRLVKLWDLATRRVLHSLKAHTTTVCGLTFSPNGRRLASGSQDGTIILWDVGTGTEVRTLHGDADAVCRIQFSRDGRLLAAGGQGGLVKVWDTSTGKAQDPLPGHTGVVRFVAFSPDGQWLASGGEDRTVLLHPLTEGRSQMFRTPSAVNEVAFSPDGRTLAAVGDAHVPRGLRDPAPKATVHLWDLESRKETTWEGHTGDIHGLAFSPAGPLLATCAEDGTVRLWDRDAAPAGVRMIGPGPFGGAVRAVAFTPDGHYLATANANGAVYLLRVGQH
jgi:WD40 repeat protein/tRNA A-37 threonylcarbamoyl transferase component Bud32